MIVTGFCSQPISAAVKGQMIMVEAQQREPALRPSPSVGIYLGPPGNVLEPLASQVLLLPTPGGSLKEPELRVLDGDTPALCFAKPFKINIDTSPQNVALHPRYMQRAPGCIVMHGDISYMVAKRDYSGLSNTVLVNLENWRVCPTFPDASASSEFRSWGLYFDPLDPCGMREVVVSHQVQDRWSEALES